MITPDMLNSIFEGGLSIFLAMSVYKLYKDKMVRGVYWPMVAFTMSWGYFNLWFYPAIDQWWSFFAGIAVVIANTAWLSQMLYYNWRERKGHAFHDGIWWQRKHLHTNFEDRADGLWGDGACMKRQGHDFGDAGRYGGG